MKLPSVADVDVAGKRLLVRADLNVPVENGRVTDATRINRFAEGMKPLLAQGARLVILTHFGRPDPNELNPAFSVDKLRPALSEALGVPVRFSDTCATHAAIIHSQQLEDGDVLLCENLRLNPGEVTNDGAFADELAKLGDVYVNDAFSCCHRSHASVDAITMRLPSVAGPLLLAEISALSDALDHPTRPSVAIIGGAKISTKIDVLINLVSKLDAIIIGGAMANTFLFADGHPMGKSLHEPDHVDTVAAVRAAADRVGCRILLPADVVCAPQLAPFTETEIVSARHCPANSMMLDAGPESLKAFEIELAAASTVLWNGPLGAFEVKPFDQGTGVLARKVAELTKSDVLVSVAGGGDTIAALNAAGVVPDFTYVSTAGGAFLEWLEGRTLAGISALQRPGDSAEITPDTSQT